MAHYLRFRINNEFDLILKRACLCLGWLRDFVKANMALQLRHLKRETAPFFSNSCRAGKTISEIHLNWDFAYFHYCLGGSSRPKGSLIWSGVWHLSHSLWRGRRRSFFRRRKSGRGSTPRGSSRVDKRTGKKSVYEKQNPRQIDDT